MMRKRSIEIINKLLLSNEPISLDFFSQFFQVSERSIRSELNEIDNFLKKTDLPNITRIRNEGYLLRMSEVQKQILYKHIANDAEVYLNRSERHFDLILSIALSSEKIFLNKKEKEYGVSKSTMDEDVRRLRTELLEYGIEMFSHGRTGVALKGSERSIRTMLFNTINKNMGLLEINDEKITPAKKIFSVYFPENLLYQLKTFQQVYLSEIHDEMYENQIVFFTSLWLLRMKMGHFISTISWENDYEVSHEGQMYIDAIAKQYQLQVPNVEIGYLEFIIKSLKSSENKNMSDWINAQVLTIQLIQEVEVQTKLSLSKNGEELYEGLFQHISALTRRMKNGIQIVNPITENIKKNYGLIFSVIENFIKNLEDKNGKKITDDEIAFLTIHFSTAISKVKSEMNYRYKSVVFCHHGVATGNLLAANLVTNFPEIEITGIFSSDDIQFISKLDVDLIFSTYDLKIDGKPYLVIDPIINKNNKHIVEKFLKNNEQNRRIEIKEQDSSNLFNALIDTILESGGTVDLNIYQKLHEVLKENDIEINLRELQPMMKDVLMNNEILIDIHPNSWEDAIQNVAQPLLIEGIITQKYIDSMIKSVKEYGPYIVIGKHLALAHARPEDGANKLGVSVATISEGVEFGNDEMDPVKIIFCLSAVDSYSHLNIMRELVELINEEEKVQQLIAAKSVEEFKALLFEDIQN